MLGQPFINLSISNQHFKTDFHPPQKNALQKFLFHVFPLESWNHKMV